MASGLMKASTVKLVVASKVNSAEPGMTTEAATDGGGKPLSCGAVIPFA